MLATPAEADREYAWNFGRDRRDQAWILSDRNCWYRNPFYVGPPVRHPEDDYGDTEDDFGADVPSPAPGPAPAPRDLSVLVAAGDWDDDVLF